MQLKKILTEKKMTFRQLSIAIGITEGHLNSVANGKADCTTAVAKKIADALDITLDELVGNESDEKDSGSVQNPTTAQDQASTGDKPD